MAHITKEEVLKLAQMSRIAIHDNEIEPLIKKLTAVLTYAERVTEIPKIEEQVMQNKNIFRDDVVHETRP